MVCLERRCPPSLPRHPQLGVSEWREERQYDVVTCMFAIHYFFVTERALKQVGGGGGGQGAGSWAAVWVGLAGARVGALRGAEPGCHRPPP